MISQEQIRNNRMLKDVEAVIFDMDGTLIDSMWIWPSVDADYLRKYQLSRPEGFEESMEGKSYVEVAQHFVDTFPGLGMTIQDVMQEWTDMTYDKYMHEVDLKEGVYEFLEALRMQGKKTGIATSNARELADAALLSLHVEGLFDSVRSACEVSAGKPSPDVYLKVCSDIGVDPARCLVFEDVPMGILAGKNAGMKVCGVDDSYSRPQEARKRELADYYIYNYFDVMNETYEVLK